MVGTDLKYVYLPYIYRLGNRDFHNLKFVAGYLRVPGQRTPTLLKRLKLASKVDRTMVAVVVLQ